jgi:Fe-S cluster assembly protein SufD
MTTMTDAAPAVSSHLHPTPSWELADHPVPTGREEVWRFSPVERLRPLFEDAPGAALAREEHLPAGVVGRTVDAAAARALAASAPVDRIAALAARHAAGARVIEVPDGVQLAEPVTVVLRGAGERAWGTQVVRVGRHAAATIVIRHEGSAVYGAKTEVLAGEGASVNLVCVQDWADDALHAGQTSIRVGRDARVRTVEVSLGGTVVRLAGTASFDGPGGSLEQYGLYFADAGQHLEHRLFVDHNEPHTASQVDYRGALQGEGARSVWIGDVLIRKDAEGITTYEQNRNLLLSDGCVADSVPNLEIETGEIAGAGHSSTTGRFDDEQLFYLMSRGIPAEEAKRLVVEGFFVDIIRRIGVPDLEQRLLGAVRAELARSVGGGAGSQPQHGAPAGGEDADHERRSPTGEDAADDHLTLTGGENVAAAHDYAIKES